MAIGEGKTTLACLGQCEEPFELSVLQQALPADVFSKWLKKIQLAEVERAAVEGLERCPFCEFATIMETRPEEDKVFGCQNPECGKESCRLCGELAHIPLRCEEVEKDAEVRKRTYIENKMTEVTYNCVRIRLLDSCHSRRHYVRSCIRLACPTSLSDYKAADFVSDH